MISDMSKYRSSCLFCDPGTHGQADQIVLKSDNFYVFAGLGAIIEGYLIITPHKCKTNGGSGTCLADLSYNLLDELAYLRGIISAFYIDTYGHPGLSFEHGRAGVCDSLNDDTMHCYHPHLCCYPGLLAQGTGFTNDPGDFVHLWDQISLPNRRECKGIHTIQSVVGSLPYLYIEHYNSMDGNTTSGLPNESRIFIAPDEQTLSSQFLRRMLAVLIKDDKMWDWAEFPTEDRVKNVTNAFANWLRKHYADYGIIIEINSPPRLIFESSVSESTIGSYEKIAEKFKKRWQGTLQFNTIGHFLSHIPSGCSGGADETIRLLDAGCGPGFYTKVFADLGFKCTAIDPSSRMLEEANHILAENLKSGTITLYQSATEDFDTIFNETFDAIWFSAVLLHIPRRKAKNFLQILNKMLADKGVLYLSTRLTCKDNGDDFPAFEVRREGRVFVYYQQSELEKLFKEASFQIIKSWGGITTIGVLGDQGTKKWHHYLLKKI